MISKLGLIFLLVTTTTVLAGDNDADNQSPDQSPLITVQPDPVTDNSGSNSNSDSGVGSLPDAQSLILDSLISKGRSDIHTVIAEMRAKLDKRLVDVFPELKEKIEQLHGDIDVCYDATIAQNVTVNIFESKVHDIVKKFFASHGHLLEGLDREKIRARVHAFLANVGQLVELLFECVVNRQQGQAAVRLGLTSLSVYSRDEFENQILNKRLLQHYRDNRKQAPKLGDGFFGDECSPESWAPEPLPAKFNWAELGKVTRVYQQQTCGSCYVYSTTSAMESQYLIRANKTASGQEGDVEYSVQATLNCMSGGCGGGSLQEPLQYFVDQGVTDYSNAPYKNMAFACNKNYPTALKARRYCYFSDSEEETMQRLLLRHGPAGVAIDASSPMLSFLKGPFTAPCNRNLDHAVLMVGWDEKYWIIKNSWGTNWGIGGYLYLPRGENKCGIQMMWGVPIVDPIPA